MNEIRSSPVKNRYILVPRPTAMRPDEHDLYLDDPDGLVILDWGSSERLRQMYPTARVVPRVWDAPIIDPADPSTHPDPPPGRWP